MCSAVDSMPRMWPVPWQRGQAMWLVFAERGLQALARKLQQAEARDLADLHARTVVTQRIAQAVFDFALVARALHVDEVDDDQAAQVAQAQLARDFIGGFEVGAERGFLDVGAARGARRVDVDRDQRLGMVDDDRAAGGQGHLARIARFRSGARSGSARTAGRRPGTA